VKRIILIAFLLVPLSGFAQESAEEPAAADLAQPRVDQVLQMLRARERKFDPFGLSMNPKVAAKLEIAPSEPEMAAESKVKTTLEEALAKLEITGVLPGRAILIGSAQIRVGQEFRLAKDDIVFHLKLTSVRLGHLNISDLETGETAVHRLRIGPTLPSAPNKRLMPVKARPDIVTIP
jgi:hypothetical protein